jgi:hypothetical protein
MALHEAEGEMSVRMMTRQILLMKEALDGELNGSVVGDVRKTKERMSGVRC